MPDAFWSLTLRELTIQQRAYMWRQEQEQWRMANIIAAIKNPLQVVQVDGKKASRKKPVTAVDVLGKTKTSSHKSSDPKEHKRILDALVEKTKNWKPRKPTKSPRSH